MSGEPLVRVAGLAKRYPVLGHRGDRVSALWDVLRGRPPRRVVSVLEDVSFEVRPGESLAVIGENGAGKSTLLKLLTGVLTPSAGRVATRGSIGALLELGAGFHPELSGRDNVRLSAALHGLDADEIRWILGIADTAFRQRLSRIRKALGELPPAQRAEAQALAYVRDPGRTVELQFGLVRRALKAALAGRAGLGTHDADGHLLVIRGAHVPAPGGNG